MLYCFAWKAEKGIDVNAGDYFSTAILNDEKVLLDTVGRDDFKLNGLILPGKRIAGFGRTKGYSLDTMPAGLGAVEAEPSEMVNLAQEYLSKVTFQINTNIILDQGMLTQYLYLDVIQQDGINLQIPLKRPDVEISWPSRGKYIVTVPIGQSFKLIS